MATMARAAATMALRPALRRDAGVGRLAHAELRVHAPLGRRGDDQRTGAPSLSSTNTAAGLEPAEVQCLGASSRLLRRR